MFDTALLFFGVGISIGMMIAIVVGAILAIPVALIFLHGVYEVIIAPIAKGFWEGIKESRAERAANPPKAPSESH